MTSIIPRCSFFAALMLLATSLGASAGMFDRIPKDFDVGKTIEKSVQDTGNAVNKAMRETESPVRDPIHPPDEVNQTVSNPCVRNPELPQCRDQQ